MTMLLSAIGTSGKGLWLPDSCREPDRPAAAVVHERQQGELSPKMRLSEFFETWFTKVVLFGSDEPCTQATLLLYAQAVSWWNSLTGDPPIERINEDLLEEFRVKLKTATFQRGPNGTKYPLSKTTQFKHITHIQFIINRLGPTKDRRRRCTGLIPAAIFFHNVKNVHTERKEPFTLEQAKAMYTAAGRMPSPENPGPNWRLILSSHFYTGLRVGTVAQLEREKHIFYKNNQPWFDVPGSIVNKTGKGTKIPIHHRLWQDMQAFPDSQYVVPRMYCTRYMHELHAELQTLAEIPEDQQQSRHAWRRTFGCELALLGLDNLMMIAQVGLNHADKKTTEAHYCNIRDQLILKLPDIAAK